MISLQTTEGGVKFVFTNSDHYLYGNGTIEVPLNSLALVTDESDMFTFKKAATNDPFISAKYSDIGMTKEELEAFYNENMVGGSGVDPEEVQALINASISGNVKSVKSYSIHGTSGDSIGLLVRNVDGSSAYTNVFTTRNGSKLRCTGNLDELHLEESFVSGIVTSAIYDSSGKTIELKNESGVTVSTIDATDFIKDGMLDSASVEDVTISGETVQCLVLTFNTESGKEPINIPLSDLSLPIDSVLSANSPNAVANSAITNAINAKADMLETDMVGSPRKAFKFRLKSGNNVLATPTINLGTGLVYGSEGQMTLSTSGLTDESAFTAFSASTEAALSALSENEETLSSALTYLNDSKLDVTAYTPFDPSQYASKADLNGYVTQEEADEWQESEALVFNQLNNRIDNKQDTLIAGSGISISGNVISAEGGGGGLDEDFLQANANALYELKQEGKATNERFDNYYTKTASDGRYASNASIKKAYYDKAYVDDKLLAISASLNELNDDKQETLVAGSGISISGNVISADGGGGGGLDDDTAQLISTALVDLEERKIDASEVNINYQKKGDYATKTELAAKANASDVMTLEKSKENEKITSYAINDLNERLTALEQAVQAIQNQLNNQ